MQLTPRYDGPDLLRWEIPLGDPALALGRQRQRLGRLLADLDDAQWAAPSRCEGWCVQDVITHLISANQFWTMSVEASRKGAPTRYLVGFDPVATPAQIVDAAEPARPAETLARFVETNAAFGAAVADMADADWLAPAEGPPGHIPTCALAAHALWDSWIHERDIVLPLGLEPVCEPDEVAESLRYAVALSPMFVAANGSTRAGTLVVDATGPDVHLVIDLGSTVVVRDGACGEDAARLSGNAVDLVEALSFRRPLDADIAPADRWMFGGLAEAFDVVV